MRFKITKFEKRDKQIRGLGDVVAMAAEPIKKAIIKHAPKQISEMIKNCNCQKRREMLNKILPL